MHYIDTDELGRFWCFNADDEPYAGPHSDNTESEMSKIVKQPAAPSGMP